MNNSTLTELLRLFTKNEIQSLKEYVSSPYFNKKAALKKLLEYLIRFHPHFPKEKVEREIIWKHLYPGKPYNYGVMKNLLYDLTKLSEDFAAETASDKSRTVRLSLLLGFAFQRGSKKLTEKYEAQAAAISAGDADNSEGSYQLSRQLAQIHFSRVSDAHRVTPGEQLERFTKNMLHIFITELFEHYIMLNDMNRVLKTHFDQPLLDKLLEFVSDNETLLSNKKLRAYFCILMFEKSGEEKYLEMTKKELNRDDSGKDARYKYSLWLSLANHFAFRFHSGDISIRREMYELNKIAIERKIYSPEGSAKFFAVNFNTIFNIAASEYEFEWAERFVEDHYEFLDPGVRDNTRFRCLADLYFRMEKFEEALDRLSRITAFNDPHEKAYIKMLTMMTYYELGYTESCINIADSFRQLLKNEKRIQKVIAEKYLKFIQGFRYLLQMKSGGKDSAEKFTLFINSDKTFGSRNWLIRKASQLGYKASKQ